MDEKRKDLGLFWTWMAGLLVVTLAATWGWQRLSLGNLAYMQFIQENNQEAVGREQQLEANELQLRQQRGECCECALVEEEEEETEPDTP